MKIALFGAGGMLGYVTYQYLKERNYQVVGITKTKRYADLICMDITDQVSMEFFLERTPFDVAVNCAALLVGASENRKSDAIKLNAWFPHFLEEFCIQHDRYLIQVSTDGVFSGRSGKYQETSFIDADTFYGKSKYLGEVSGDHALTVRSGFWGVDINVLGQGLFQWFVRQKGPVSGYSRAFFNGISNLEFAKFVELTLLNRWTGIYHLCASDIVSKHRFLSIENDTFEKDIEIIADEQVCVDRSLVCTRHDVQYQQKTFERMMSELKDWIMERPEFVI